MSDVKRKFATILATDCVGFSKHMLEDEDATFESLNACRQIIDLIENTTDVFFTQPVTLSSRNSKVLLKRSIAPSISKIDLQRNLNILEGAKVEKCSGGLAFIVMMSFLKKTTS